MDENKLGLFYLRTLYSCHLWSLAKELQNRSLRRYRCSLTNVKIAMTAESGVGVTPRATHCVRCGTQLNVVQLGGNKTPTDEEMFFTADYRAHTHYSLSASELAPWLCVHARSTRWRRQVPTDSVAFLLPLH